MRSNPTKRNFNIATNAARLAAQLAQEPLKSEALALAEDWKSDQLERVAAVSGQAVTPH